MPSSRLRHPLRALRARLACERGQATVNWLTVMVGLTVLAAALVLALPSVAPKLVCSFQNVVAKVSGGAVPECNYTASVDDDVPAASTCLVSERSGEAGATVTVVSVKGGAKVKVITRRTADGKVYVTVEGGGEIGLEFGPPAGGELTIDTGNSETTEGANAKAGAKLNGNGSLTWAFDSPAEAKEFADIVAGKARDAALDTNPITGIGRRVLGVGEDRDIPAPSIYGLEGGATIFGEAEGGAGPLSGKAEGELGASIGGRYDARTKQTTVYFKVNESGKAGGELFKLAGGRGLAEGEVQLAVTVDSKGQPVQATIIGSGHGGRAAHRQARRPVGQARRLRQARRRAHRPRPHRPGQPRGVQWLRQRSAGRRAGPGPALHRRLAGRRAPLRRKPDRCGHQGRCVDRRRRVRLDVGGKYKESDLDSAYYYDRESGTFVPWVECKS